MPVSVQAFGSDGRRRAKRYRAGVELVDFGLDPGASQVGHRDHPRACVQHLACLGVALQDHAIDGCNDAPLGQERREPLHLGGSRSAARQGAIALSLRFIERLLCREPA